MNEQNRILAQILSELYAALLMESRLFAHLLDIEDTANAKARVEEIIFSELIYT